MPIVDLFAASGKTKRINALKSIDDVAKEMEEAFTGII